MQMRWQINRRDLIVWIIGFIIGWIFGLWIKDYAIWVYDNKIGTFDFLSLVTTVGSALFIAWVIERNNDINHQTKKLLIKHADDIDHLTKHLQELCLTLTDIPYTFLTYDTSQIGRDYQKLKNDLNEKLGLKISKERDQSIKAELLKVRRYCTDSSIIIGGLTIETTISNGLVKISSQRCAEVLNSLSKISEEIRDIKYMIISAK
jgi:hypothetical protein